MVLGRTLSAIYEVTQYLYNNMDQGRITYCAFIDYSKAFNTLDHGILIQKLRDIGISPSVTEWCHSYFSGRKQCVKDGADMSEDLIVNYGVPQGSILGLLFFILYVNDLLKLCNNHDPKITLYTDDTVIYIISASSAELACNALENGLTKLTNWCDQIS